MSFKPPLWSVLLSLLAISLFIRLGVWQLHRGTEKSNLLKQHKRHSIKPVIFPSKGTLTLSQALKVTGTFDNDHTFLLDNQFYHHRVGFDVITPMKIEENKWLLVDRGWVKAQVNRQDLPLIPPIMGVKTLTGRVYFPSIKARVLNDELDNAGHWPLIIEKIGFDDMKKYLVAPLYPFVLRLDKERGSNFVRDWSVVSMKPAKHYGYAFQWFSFALVVLVLFLYLNVEKKRDAQ